MTEEEERLTKAYMLALLESIRTYYELCKARGETKGNKSETVGNIALMTAMVLDMADK